MRRTSRQPPPLPPPPLTATVLRALYADLNRSRFGGRLPPGVVESQQPPRGLIASTHARSALGPSIWIHPLFAALEGEAWVRRVLLHEMCHVEVGTDGGAPEPEHGPRWRAAMLRLQEQGEDWVGDDMASMAAKEAEQDRLVARIIKAMDELDPGLTFAQASELLLERFRRSRGRRFGLRGKDVIWTDARIIEHWHMRGGRFS